MACQKRENLDCPLDSGVGRYKEKYNSGNGDMKVNK